MRKKELYIKGDKNPELRKIFYENNITQADISRIVGKSKGAVCRWLRRVNSEQNEMHKNDLDKLKSHLGLM